LAKQRLSTLTILFSVLRNSLGEEYAKNIKIMIAQEGNRLLQTKDLDELKNY
jgi:hypothetical protein